MPDDELATAHRRIAELEAENASLRSRLAALGSTHETWRQVVELMRERLGRWIAREREG